MDHIWAVEGGKEKGERREGGIGRRCNRPFTHNVISCTNHYLSLVTSNSLTR